MEYSEEGSFSRSQVEAGRRGDFGLQGERTRGADVADRLAAPIRIHVLASGSKGNATLVENVATGEGILIDCGISKRDFLARCGEAQFDPTCLRAILITHEHSDHTKGLGVVARGLAKMAVEPVLYVNNEVARASRELEKLSCLSDRRDFDEGDALSLAGLQVYPFATSHDAVRSFGFRVESCDDALGFMTDTGIVTPSAHEALENCRLLALESNHDERMLRTGSYPYVVKQRIASERGHLDNVQAAEELERLLCGRLEHVVALHISENNNTYRMPVETLRDVMERNGHTAAVSCGYQQRMVSVS